MTTSLFIIGDLIRELPNELFPSNRRMLQSIYFQHISCKKTVKMALEMVAAHLKLQWKNGNVLSIPKGSMIQKLQRLIMEYNLVKKNKNSKQKWQILKQQDFVKKLDITFEVAVTNSNVMPKNIKEKSNNAHENNNVESLQLGRGTKRKRSCKCLREYDIASDNDSMDLSNDVYDVEYGLTLSAYQQKMLDVKKPTQPTTAFQTIIDSPDLTSMADRINISDSQFVLLAGSMARATGEDFDDLVLSRSSFRRKRIKNRSGLDTAIRDEFVVAESAVLTVHWDGKKMDNITGLAEENDIIERVGVVITGHQVEKILGKLCYSFTGPVSQFFFIHFDCSIRCV
jgi:DUF2075 family protein